MTQTFDKLNGHMVYAKVESRSEALKLRDNAIETANRNKGKTVVIFFDNQYYLHLAPGQDPYKIRKEINAWMSQEDNNSETTTEITTKPKTKSSQKSKLKTV